MTKQIKTGHGFIVFAASLLPLCLALTGCHHTHSIVGHWRGALPVGRNASAAIEIAFRPDRTMTETVTFNGARYDAYAEYTIKGDTLTESVTGFTSKGGPILGTFPQFLHYNAAADTLALVVPNAVPHSDPPCVLHRVTS